MHREQLTPGEITSYENLFVEVVRRRSRKIAGCAKKIAGTANKEEKERGELARARARASRQARKRGGEGIGRIILRQRACLLVEKFWSSRLVGSLRPQLHLQVIRLTSTEPRTRISTGNSVAGLSVFASSSLSFIFFIVLVAFSAVA